MFFKPNVTRVAPREYGFDFEYASGPNWPTYASLLDFAARVTRDQRDLGPRDMIGARSFIWVQDSDEYEGSVAADGLTRAWPSRAGRN